MSTANPDQKNPSGAGGPLYSRAVILGVGLIGGSLALAFRRSGLVREIVGVSRRRTIDRALELGVIDSGFERGNESVALAGADLVVLAGPVRVIIDQLGRLGSQLEPGATVTDVGSTKREIVAAGERLPDRVQFIGGHPMAGAETTGVESADPFLFENAVYVLCPPAGGQGNESLRRYSRLVSATGARLMLMSPEDHDRIAATISHLPQMIAVALMNLAAGANESDPDTLRLAAGGFRDLTRIASSPYEMWHDICCTNSDQIKALIDLFIGRLEDVRELVGGDSLGERFTRAAAARALIHRDVKGFLSPVHQVVVTAPDEVGVIRRMAVGLADEGINIKDIEVLKVREGEGGTIMVGFATVEDRARAVGILEGLGFPTRIRE